MRKYQLVSYPKSGRSWIRFVLSELDLDKEIKFQHDQFEFNDGDMPPHDFDLERRLEHYAQVEKLVYLERDPRDVMVSLYHQVTGRFDDFFHYTGTLSEFLRDDYFGAENLHRFRGMWAELVEQLGLLKVTYEDCHADMAGQIRRLADYYGFDVSDEAVHRAVGEGDFDNMKSIEQSGEFPKPWLRTRNDAPKVRQGKVGGYRSALAPEDIAYLNGIFGILEDDA